MRGKIYKLDGGEQEMFIRRARRMPFPSPLYRVEGLGRVGIYHIEGRLFTLSWEEIYEMAIEAGIMKSTAGKEAA